MPNAKGVPEAAVTRGAGMGVCKVNIDTDIRLGLTAKHARQKVLILLTVQTMNGIHTGYHRIAL